MCSLIYRKNTLILSPKKEKNQPLIAFILPILAVLLGLCIALLFRPAVDNGVKLLLSFSGAFLLSVTIFELLPEVYGGGTENVGLFIIAGLLTQIFLEFGSKGAEHGHMHHQDSAAFPWLLFLSLCIHALLEGFPIADNDQLLYGIVVHKIPIAIIISSFLLKSKMSRWMSVLFLLIFASMTPLGAFAKAAFPALQEHTTLINAFVVGVLLHVSTTILFESSKNHQFNASKLVVILLGIIIAYFI